MMTCSFVGALAPWLAGMTGLVKDGAPAPSARRYGARRYGAAAKSGCRIGMPWFGFASQSNRM